MELKGVVHEAEEGGYWAEVPCIPSNPSRTRVPVYGNADLKIGLQRQVMKISSIDEDGL